MAKPNAELSFVSNVAPKDVSADICQIYHATNKANPEEKYVVVVARSEVAYFDLAELNTGFTITHSTKTYLDQTYNLRPLAAGEVLTIKGK